MTDPSTAEPRPAPPALQIPTELLGKMIAHCKAENPLECCGLLGGAPPLATSIHPLRNTAASETRYTADPRQVVEAWRWLREHNAQVLAIYHSHPRWAPIPSKADLQENYWGDTPRIIISLLSDPPEVRVWRLDPAAFTELPWSEVGPPDAHDLALQARPSPD